MRKTKYPNTYEEIDYKGKKYLRIGQFYLSRGELTQIKSRTKKIKTAKERKK